jgi:hypothetical protein
MTVPKEASTDKLLNLREQTRHSTLLSMFATKPPNDILCQAAL